MHPTVELDVARHNTTFTLADTKQVLLEAPIAQVTPDQRKAVVQHVIEEVESKMWEIDNLMEEYEIQVDPAMITFSSDDEEV